MAAHSRSTAPPQRRTAGRHAGRSRTDDPRDTLALAGSALEAGGLLRLPLVLALVGVSASTWWAGVRSGRFPPGVKVTERCTAWRAADIRAMLDSAGGEGES
ncbi:MAG: AlpA family phage regulatory protein [Xanthomonadales bacterium]|nr:AlpA family phage regulatory protein [Xanthomonadales bacterium]